MPGPAPLPTKIRDMRGNTSHRPRNEHEPDPREDSGYCPRHLSRLAKTEWRRVAPELKALGLLTKVDRGALEAYCEAYATWRQAKVVLDEQGFTFETDKGFIMQRPEVSISNNALKLMKTFMCEFGMTPSSRSKISIPPPKEVDPFEELISRGRVSEKIAALDEDA